MAVFAWFALTAATAGPDDERPVERGGPAGASQRAPGRPALYLIGDSTVKVGTAGQKGWGEEIAGYFNPDVITVINRAIGGRSSRTFLTEGRWDQVLAELQRGDFVLIQFGHNDGGPINDDFRARGSIRGIGEETEEIDNLLTHKREVVHTYGWYLRQYVRDAQAKGATAIVCSLVPRKIWTEEGKIARTPDSYADWARQVAEQTGAHFLDLHELIARRYEELGPAAVEPLFADARTHTTAEGARFSAETVVRGLKALRGNPMGPSFSAAASTVAPATP